MENFCSTATQAADLAELRALLAQATRPRVRAALNASLSDWLSMAPGAQCGAEALDGDQLPHIEELEVYCIYVCMHACMCVCMHVCMYLCIYVFMYLCICVFMYVCIYVMMYVIYLPRTHTKCT